MIFSNSRVAKTAKKLFYFYLQFDDNSIAALVVNATGNDCNKMLDKILEAAMTLAYPKKYEMLLCYRSGAYSSSIDWSPSAFIVGHDSAQMARFSETIQILNVCLRLGS